MFFGSVNDCPADCIDLGRRTAQHILQHLYQFFEKVLIFEVNCVMCL